MNSYKEETKSREKLLEGMLRLPSNRSFDLMIQASDFDSGYLRFDGSSRRPQVLIEAAIIDACLHNSDNVEILSDEWDGVVTAFNGFVVIKNRVYKFKPYTEKALETDMRIARYHNFSNHVVRTIQLVACELITVGEPENLN